MSLKVRTSNELQIGKAGEYLVCADLILKGFIAYPSEQGLPYDICLDTGGSIKRIQVKTTSGYREIPQRKTETNAYIFHVRRHGKNNDKIYHNDEVDLFALVALDIDSVGYIKNEEMPTTINLRVDKFRGEYYDEQGLKNYKDVQRLKEKGMRGIDIARELDMDHSPVYRMMKDDYEPHITDAKYFSDIEREPEWFINET